MAIDRIACNLASLISNRNTQTAFILFAALLLLSLNFHSLFELRYENKSLRVELSLKCSMQLEKSEARIKSGVIRLDSITFGWMLRANKYMWNVRKCHSIDKRCNYFYGINHSYIFDSVSIQESGFQNNESRFWSHTRNKTDLEKSVHRVISIWNWSHVMFKHVLSCDFWRCTNPSHAK